MSEIRRFLLFMSKSDPVILAHCGNYARMTQASLGFAILLTGTWAFLALSYAASMVFESTVIALFCGLLYACVMVWFDREVVSCFRKRQVWMRIPIAVLFGMIAAVPLDLRLFEGRIEEELRSTDREKNGAFHAEVARIREEAFGRIDLQDARIRDLDAGRKRLQARLDPLREETTELERKANAAWQFMAGEEFGREGDGLSGLRGEGPNYEYHRRILDGTKARLEALTNERQVLEQELGELRQRSDTLVGARDARVAAIELEKEEALERARERLYIASPTDLLARFEALLRLTGSSNGARVLAFLLWVFFVLIETSPALAKAFIPETEYNAIVEAECVKNSHRVVQISNHAVLEIKQNPYDPGTVSLEDYLREHPIRWEFPVRGSDRAPDSSEGDAERAAPAVIGLRGDGAGR